MSISGSIEVNGQEVGHWEASRVETGAVNTYACVVDWTPKDWVRWNGQRYPFWSGGRRANGGKEITHAHRHAFSTEHREEDGAVALAAKVLANSMADPSPTTPSHQPIEEAKA